MRLYCDINTTNISEDLTTEAHTPGIEIIRGKLVRFYITPRENQQAVSLPGGSFVKIVIKTLGKFDQDPPLASAILQIPTDTNEVQTLTIGGSTTGGSFTLTFDGQTTAAINWSATTAALLANINAGLLALSNVEAGDIVATEGSLASGNGTVLLTFGAAYAFTDASLITFANSLTGGTHTLAIAETTPGSNSQPPYLVEVDCDTALVRAAQMVDGNDTNDIDPIATMLGIQTSPTGLADTWHEFKRVNTTLSNRVSDDGDSDPDAAPATHIRFFSAVNDYIGGASNQLDSVLTVGRTVPQLASFAVGDTAEIYELVTGTDAESSPEIIRPDDYNGSTNAKVWKRRVAAVASDGMQQGVGATMIGDGTTGVSFNTPFVAPPSLVIANLHAPSGATVVGSYVIEDLTTDSAFFVQYSTALPSSGYTIHWLAFP